MRVAAIDRESATRDLRPPRARSTASPRCRAARPVPDRAPATRRRTAPLLRTYSLSDLPSAESYRISVKREPHGAASEYLHSAAARRRRDRGGAPRGAFVLRAGDRPVVLLSAGVGATPVLAMLHALADEASARPVWWLHGARNHAEHSFAQEVLDLLALLPDAHGSSATAAETEGLDGSDG